MPCHTVPYPTQHRFQVRIDACASLSGGRRDTETPWSFLLFNLPLPFPLPVPLPLPLCPPVSPSLSPWISLSPSPPSVSLSPSPLSFLHLLSSHDWATSPLIIDPSHSLTRQDRRAIQVRHSGRGLAPSLLFFLFAFSEVLAGVLPLHVPSFCAHVSECGNEMM